MGEGSYSNATLLRPPPPPPERGEEEKEGLAICPDVCIQPPQQIQLVLHESPPPHRSLNPFSSRPPNGKKQTKQQKLPLLEEIPLLPPLALLFRGMACFCFHRPLSPACHHP